ncbi:hypothetical protein DMC30DRAFT_53948 [Rhodotorula diobovata]|uniref:U4/U6 snRNA-associated-splicing factor PRP24 n=1 Tax=Rhodotorula diobovata TaxID=5288 RepID=A0A5C5FRA0_9BASI|nr:hypothetical protein DMC30DRAFT_53948 [Rhodotorula diobovata]
MAQDQLVEEYGALLEQLNAAPFQRDLHEQRIALASRLELADEVEQGRNGLAQYFPLSQAEWTAWLDDRKSALPAPPTDDVTPLLELVELYRRASRDQLSIPLLVSWTQWTIASYYAAQGLSPAPPPAEADDEDAAMEPASRKVGEPDELLGVVFSLEEVRGVCDEVLKIAGAHIAEVWTLWRDFEMDLLKLDPSPDQLLQVEQMYLARLKVPHLDIAETFSAYSSFVTNFDNDNYNKSLPAANKIFSATAKKSDERYAEEEKLKAAGYTPQAYLDYVSWEREVKRPDTPLVKGIFERAVADHPTEIDLWDEYLGFLHKIPEKESNLREVSEKAIRNLPTATSLWTAAMRVAEKLGLGAEEVEALFQRAVATGYFAKDIEAHVALYHARASYYRREMDRNATDDGPDAQLAGLAIGVLQEGIESNKKVNKKGGDPQFRLEKFLIRIYERFQMTAEARAIWEGLCKTRQHSYAVWYGHADFETRMGDYARAHKVYTEGCAIKGLDYPEYLLEAWITFENEYGVLADVDFALVKAKRQRKGLEKRRAREAADAAAKAAAAAPPATDADSFISSAVGQAPMQEGADASKKRERSPQDESAPAQGAKKVRVEAPEPAGEPKRDREHSTVFAISSGEMSEDDVRRLFRDCGEIRELHVKTIDQKSYAQIEFVNKESVLAAQTKDKKRINDLETEVYIAWQSCLYVTNFPESFDKAALEHLFAKYGTIFDTRWPSKRFKNTRRFCYVQFANPAHSQAALELNGTELEPGHALSVLISDPSRKKSRSDAGAHQRELYVASLAKSVKEVDLRKLFEPFGTVLGVRIPQDDKGLCKGFAFVEFENESAAQEALSLNNHELKKRHMSVTVAQARQAGTGKFSQPERRVETENRGVRVRGLANDTQEAVIQQEFEKIAPVRRVNYVAGSSEAVVLLENPADVGKVLMQRDAMLINGQQVTLLAEGRQTRPAAGGAKQGTGATGEGAPNALPMMPRQATRSRGRVGLVGGRGRGGRGGRLGIGAGRSVGSLAAQGQEGASSSGDAPGDASMAAPGDKSAEGKSQDDFRAMLLKGKK